MQDKSKNNWKDFLNIKEVFKYLIKGSSQKNASSTVKAMHLINRVAIIIFLLGVIYLVVKRLI
ncbi:DUF6728 family protein [Aureibacter tunicatorum]|uniref:DUF6728 family protein n=1 Tax=Aureibacter tunicatorum TaxID=866807 RepID=UPI0035B510D4